VLGRPPSAPVSKRRARSSTCPENPAGSPFDRIDAEYPTSGFRKKVQDAPVMTPRVVNATRSHLKKSSVFPTFPCSVCNGARAFPGAPDPPSTATGKHPKPAGRRRTAHQRRSRQNQRYLGNDLCRLDWRRSHQGGNRSINRSTCNDDSGKNKKKIGFVVSRSPPPQKKNKRCTKFDIQLRCGKRSRLCVSSRRSGSLRELREVVASWLTCCCESRCTDQAITLGAEARAREAERVGVARGAIGDVLPLTKNSEPLNSQRPSGYRRELHCSLITLPFAFCDSGRALLLLPPSSKFAPFYSTAGISGRTARCEQQHLPRLHFSPAK